MGSGLCASVLLVVLFHLLHLTRPVTMDGYFITRPIKECISPIFIASYAISGMLLSRIKVNPFLISFGMILPLPLGFLAEVTVDPTNHNLFPLEILFMWVPAFLLALTAVLAGRIIQKLIHPERS